MKRSEFLYRQTNEALNNNEFFRLQQLTERAQRLENFVDFYLPRIKPLVLGVAEMDYLFIIQFSDGTIADYYPQKDRVFIKTERQWRSDGLAWLLLKLDLSV